MRSVHEIVAEMRSHASGSAETAWYDRDAWNALCDELEASAAPSRGDGESLIDVMRSVQRLESRLQRLTWEPSGVERVMTVYCESGWYAVRISEGRIPRYAFVRAGSPADAVDMALERRTEVT